MTDEKRRATPDGRAVADCEGARVLIMGYIDGELDAPDIRRVEDHLAVCVECRREEQAYRRLGEVTDVMLQDTAPVDIGRAWERIYDRLARGLGWALIWVGILALGGFALWQLGAEFLFDPEVPAMVRLGVGSLAGGALLLLVNILRERFTLHRTERYREVQR